MYEMSQRTYYNREQVSYFLSVGSMALMVSMVVQLGMTLLQYALYSVAYRDLDISLSRYYEALIGGFGSTALIPLLIGSICAILLGLVGKSGASSNPRAGYCAGFGVGGGVLVIFLIGLSMLI